MNLSPHTVYWAAHPYTRGDELHEGKLDKPDPTKAILITNADGQIPEMKIHGRAFRYKNSNNING